VSAQVEAALELHRFFTDHGIAYALIGGFAVQFWGEPRFTQDLDITILVPSDEEEAVLGKILDHFAPRRPDAMAFALKHRICLVSASSGCPIDISLGIPGFEEEVMRRAVVRAVRPKNNIRICSAEDLILHKAVAGRPVDEGDIEGILLRQGGKLNLRYIRRWLKAFSQVPELEGVDKLFEKLRRKSRKI